MTANPFSTASEIRPGKLEKTLIWYARRFPVEHGKLRVIDYAWKLAAATNPTRTAALVYGGFKAPCDLRDMLQRQFYFFGTYFIERDLLACWSVLARRAGVIVDVGANAGIYSLAALAANPRATVHAFEPTPEIADRLRKTALMNALERLHVHQAAISSKSGSATLIRCRGENDDNDGMNFIRASLDPRAEQVRTETLDGFCKAAGIDVIDLLKIDIQGAEPDALRGASELLSAGRIHTLFMELNWSNADNCPATQAIEILSSAGYLFAQPTAALKWRSEGAWLKQLSDIVAAPRILCVSQR